VNRWQAVALSALLGCAAHEASFAAPAMSDAQIRDAIIAESVSRYSGTCPCPYNVMRNGRRCGGNSAYSRAGGASLFCFPQDITPEMVSAYRSRVSGR